MMDGKAAASASGLAKGPVGRFAQSPYVTGGLAMLLYAGTFAMVRGLAVDVPPLGLSFWRGVLAAVVFLAWAAPQLRGAWPTIRARWKSFALLGVLQTGLGNTASVVAMHSTTVVNASFINATIAVVIVGLAWLIYRETVSRRQAMGIALSCLGVLILIARADISVVLNLDFNVGDLWILLAVLNWGLYAVVIRRMIAGIPVIAGLAALTVAGVIELAPFYLWENFTRGSVTVDAPFLTTVVYLGGLTTVLATALWTRTLGVLGPQRASVFQHLIPVFSIVFGVGFLGERLFPYHLLGAALIATGIWFTAFVRTRRAAG
jgi:drug/metabolite transporter (DMT)-like permease